MERENAFETAAIKYQLAFGEEGQEIVRMVTQYINEGWMTKEQAAMMLRAIFEPEPDDGKEENAREINS